MHDSCTRFDRLQVEISYWIRLRLLTYCCMSWIQRIIYAPSRYATELCDESFHVCDPNKLSTLDRHIDYVSIGRDPLPLHAWLTCKPTIGCSVGATSSWAYTRTFELDGGPWWVDIIGCCQAKPRRHPNQIVSTGSGVRTSAAVLKLAKEFQSFKPYMDQTVIHHGQCMDAEWLPQRESWKQ